MSRILKYFLVTFLLILLIVTLAGVIIARYYQDEVKQLMISQINRHVKTEIRVGDLSFSVLRKFPRASLEFRDVVILAPDGYIQNTGKGIDSDTLFTARSLFLQFSLNNIFRKDYRIRNIHAVNGILNLALNADGQENYRFWKTPDSPDNRFNLDLQDVRLSNYRVIFTNEIQEIYFDSDFRRLELKGNFSQSSYSLRAIATGTSRRLRHQGIYVSGNRDISAKISLDVDDELFDIKEGMIELSGVTLSVGGVYKTGDQGYADIKISGYNLDIASLIDLLPENIGERLDPYRFSGRFDFESSISGEVSKTISPSVFVSFETENGQIIRRDTGMRLNDVSLSGYFSNGPRQNAQTSTIVVRNFYTGFGKGSIRASGGISDLSQPVVTFDTDASFLLEEMARFYKPANIKQIAGRINTVFSANGRIDTLVKWGIEELNKMDLSGVMEIENGFLEISEGRYVASGIGGELNFGKTLRTPELNFNIGSDHFSIRGEIDNGLPWLLGQDETMRISGGLYSRQLNLDNYIHTSRNGQQHQDAREPLIFPSNVELSLDFLVDELTFRKFSSTLFRGKLSYKPKMMTLNEVEFNSMDGAISGNGVIAQRINDDFMFQSQLQMRNVDMQKMFYSFNNFEQTFIHGDHLQGKLTGNLGFISEWNPYLQIIWEKLVADSKVEIRNGELINFEPMLGLSRFIDVAELQHIRFSTLQNEIFIRNQVITIPQMDINSSAFNISGSGTHRFDGHFDYRMRVLLSDVLYGRARRAKPENQEFGIVEDDGLGRTSLYLLVSGTPEDYRVSYDRGAVRDMIRESITEERNALRQLLHEEFGWFSSDSSAKGSSSATEASGSRFRITWDEEDENTPPAGTTGQPSRNSRHTRERSLEIIWDEEEKSPEKPGQ